MAIKAAEENRRLARIRAAGFPLTAMLVKLAGATRGMHRWGWGREACSMRDAAYVTPPMHRCVRAPHTVPDPAALQYASPHAVLSVADSTLLTPSNSATAATLVDACTCAPLHQAQCLPLPHAAEPCNTTHPYVPSRLFPTTQPSPTVPDHLTSSPPCAWTWAATPPIATLHLPFPRPNRVNPYRSQQPRARPYPYPHPQAPRSLPSLVTAHVIAA